MGLRMLDPYENRGHAAMQNEIVLLPGTVALPGRDRI